MILKFILSIFVILFVLSITPAYAQHHSGSLSPPIDLDGLQVAVSTTLFPEDFSYGDSKSTNLSIRFFDSETAVSYTHLRAHETVLDLVCRLLLEKKKIS